jgi:GH15 family glucan-1,4-alpha-glucosidase
VYESARDFIVRPLLANLEPVAGAGSDAQDDGRDAALIVRADTSIWEEHEADRRHFAWTTATAIAGLRAFAGMARQQGDVAAQAEAAHAVGQLRRGFGAAFVRDGSLRGTQEPGTKNDIDGALPALVGLGVLDDRALIEDVVARMHALEVASGGYRRVRGTYTDPKVFEYWYEQQEFVFVDLALAGVLRTLGRHAQAAPLLRKVLDDAAAHDGLIPEMYVSVPCALFPGPVGGPTGANPMVGYGAGAIVMELLEPAGH